MTLLDFDIHCVGCGRNLRTCDSQAACPRCGQPVAETLSLALVDPVDLRVSGDLGCTGCGYNLRTLHTSSLCPECGKPVAPTLSPDPLRRASRDWLNLMRRGLNILAAVAFAFAVQTVVSCIAWSLLSVGSFFAGWALYGVSQLCFVLWCYGVLRATQAEPAQSGGVKIRNWRAWARVTAIATIICNVSIYIQLIGYNWWCTGQFALMPSPGVAPGFGQMVFRSAQSMATAALLAASWMLLFAHLGQILRRSGRGAALFTGLICLFGIHGIIQVVQHGPLYFVMMYESQGQVLLLARLGLSGYGLWHFVHVVQSLWLSAILLVAGVAFLRCSRILRNAAEGRMDR